MKSGLKSGVVASVLTVTLGLTALVPEAKACIDIPPWAMPILFVAAGVEVAVGKTGDAVRKHPPIDLKNPEKEYCPPEGDVCMDRYRIQYSSYSRNKLAGQILVVTAPKDKKKKGKFHLKKMKQFVFKDESALKAKFPMLVDEKKLADELGTPTTTTAEDSDGGVKHEGSHGKSDGGADAPGKPDASKTPAK